MKWQQLQQKESISVQVTTTKLNSVIYIPLLYGEGIFFYSPDV